jgi:hypothetical protein
VGLRSSRARGKGFGEAADVQIVRSRVLLAYLAVQGALIGAFLALPSSSPVWVYWQVAVGWLSSAYVLHDVRGRPARTELVRLLFAAGIFLNASGILVQDFEDRIAGPMISPHPADAFWLALYPCVILGLAMIVHRRSAADDAARLAVSTAVSTAITVGVGIVAWKMVIVPQAASGLIGPLGMLITTLYPMGDLVVLALILRLLLSGGAQSWAFGLILLAVICFLAADMGWVIPLHSGVPLSPPVGRLLKATSLVAFASLSAAVCHASFRLTPLPLRGRAGPAVWVSLAVSLLVAPAVLGLQALVDKIYSDGL